MDDPSIGLGPREAERLARDGVCFLPSIFSKAEVEVLREETERCTELDREEISRGMQGEALFPVIEDDVIAPVIEEHGTFTPIGPAGSVILFSDCIAHGSPPSESEQTRHIVYLTFNRISNPLTHATRPWYMGNRKPARIDAGKQEALASCRPGPPDSNA